jgi:Leucine-rich repeat (LRR) protein
MKSLVHLDLFRNKLNEVPNLRGILSLNFLGLSGNIIRQIPGDAFANTTITELRLSENSLETPPDLTSIAASLEILWMTSNRLSSFPPEYFTQMMNLKELFLGLNYLSTVPRLHGLQLDKLYLSANPLELRPGDFHNVSVKDLHIFYTRISDITPLFDLVDSLEELRIYDTDLSRVTAADLQRLIQGKLQRLYINNCKLTTFPDIRNSNLTIRSFGFIEQENLFICDCRMWWITEMHQMRERDLGQLDEWTCANPVSLRRRQVLYQWLSDFCPGRVSPHLNKNTQIAHNIFFASAQRLPNARLMVWHQTAVQSQGEPS